MLFADTISTYRDLSANFKQAGCPRLSRITFDLLNAGIYHSAGSVPQKVEVFANALTHLLKPY